MNQITGLAIGRLALGVATLLSPRLAAGATRLDLAGNPQLGYMTRLFGAREIALGAAQLLTKGETRRLVTIAGLLIDTADTAAAVLAVQDGSVSKPTGLLLGAPAAAAVATGAAALTGLVPLD